MNFIYRIYEVTKSINGMRVDNILNQEVVITESRETFKENIRTLYPNIKFANNGKLKEGDIYCIIISDNCFNAAEYLAVKDFVCNHCGKTFKSNERLLNRYYSAYEFKTKHVTADVLKEYEARIKDMRFCSKECLLNHKGDVISMLEEETLNRQGNDKDFAPDIFITRHTFDKTIKGVGYIYKISKKSTKEFYVGQTSYVPIYRWGQHLLTERFDIRNIDDYIFEILEVVKNTKKLNERERYWINKCRDENPSLSLNVMIPKEKVDKIKKTNNKKK